MPEQFEVLLVMQISKCDAFDRFITNFKKCSKANQTRGYLTGRREGLEALWKEFNQIHMDLCVQRADSHKSLPYFAEDWYSRYEEFYYDFYGKISDLLNDVSVSKKPSSDIKHNNSEIKLPPIDLPKFSGNFCDWLPYRDMFVSLVGGNQTLTGVQKLHYLKASVSGEAEQLLRSYAVIEDNFNPAWESMCKRYENKRLLINAQLSILLNTTANIKEDATSIRRLYDATNESLVVLSSLGVKCESWDLPIIFAKSQRLPHETRQVWEEKISSTTEPPTLKAFLEFLESRFRTLEALGAYTPNKAVGHQVKSFLATKDCCLSCGQDHTIRQCAQFLQLRVDRRWNFVKNKKLCFNCLSGDHVLPKCPSKRGCMNCGQRHHSLLHNPSNSNSSNQVTSFHAANNNNCVLLSTALIKAHHKGFCYTLRALIDTGSQASFITTTAMQRLRLKPTPTAATIMSLGGIQTCNSHQMVQLQFTSCHDDSFQATVDTIVLPSLTELIPQVKCSLPPYPHLANLSLADPSYDNPGTIDVILGSETYPKIIRNGLRTGPSDSPIAQRTALGWIILGPVPQSTFKPICSFFNKVELDAQLRKFWEVEEPDFITSSHSEMDCDDHFLANHTRNNDGRYEVSLPFKTSPTHLGSSYAKAFSQLKSLERKFQHNPNLKHQYSTCLQEYIDLGHMEPIPAHKTNEKPNYYMPHHAVWKESSSTTKLRVVFNASCKSDNGLSLNEILHSGPSLHQDIGTVVRHWRFHRLAYAADMKQMFRQIRVSEKDSNLQRILWRDPQSSPVQHFRLRTLTFGVTSSPFLAMRTIRQLVEDDGEDFKIGAKVLTNDVYVDNVLSGADTLKEVLQAQEEVTQLLLNGGFQLRQWAANDLKILANIPEADRLISDTLHIKDNSSPISMLGVMWNTQGDTLSLRSNIKPDRPTTTKREILSCIATLFDPLGWCSPVIIRAKIFMKKLWLIGLEWDERVPDDEIREFEKLKATFISLDKMTIPRWVKTTSISTFELHGFCDSSKEAYAAAIYIRVYYSWDKSFHTSLITAKTRVSPIDKKSKKLPKTKEPEKITLPKLELCGAALLAKLLTKVIHDLGYVREPIYCWSDSTIVLAWLAKTPANWKTFVANRVSSIQTSLPTATWSHVSSGDNPADLATRGIDPATLSASSLWWHGPNWLSADPSLWPQHQLFETSDEKRKIINMTTQLEWKHELLPLTKYSSYFKLLRVTSYCFRFISNCRRNVKQNSGHLKTHEINDALLYWVRTIQTLYFSPEIDVLKLKEPISAKSKIRSLNPIINDDNILRVGGRLQHSALPNDEKHPIILPYGHHLTKLIISHNHHQTLHGGLTQTMHQVRRKFWIPKLRSTIKAFIHRCIPCFRQLKATSTQLMGNLPLSRINPSRAFSTTGLDYAGPLSIRMSKGRNPRTYKGYIAIFVCFVTKAIHLEAVSDLTTEALLAALRRFIARRGLCKNIYSDCGTNFVGADSALNKIYKNSIRSSTAAVAESIANDSINWHFIPPGSPHFGGLWEAGVKSVKHHLRRVVGNHILTYEELATILAQIEACLNSRPLCPLTDNPEELETLTPGHFLIGDALLAPPQDDLTDSKISGLKRWNLLQKLQQDFWNKWRSEYLHRLQQRPKWQRTQPNPEVGQLVIIKDERMPPLKWMMARIIAVHPGADGLVRVVDLKTSCSALRRPIHKICILPTNDSWPTETIPN